MPGVVKDNRTRGQILFGNLRESITLLILVCSVISAFWPLERRGNNYLSHEIYGNFVQFQKTGHHASCSGFMGLFLVTQCAPSQ